MATVVVAPNKGSYRRQQPRRKVARFHLRIRNQRYDLVHKATTSLVGRFDLICIEDRNLKRMAKTKRSRPVLDAPFGEVRRQLQYKTAWNSRRLLVDGRFFPSTKRCTGSHAAREGLTLADRA